MSLESALWALLQLKSKIVVVLGRSHLHCYQAAEV